MESLPTDVLKLVLFRDMSIQPLISKPQPSERNAWSYTWKMIQFRARSQRLVCRRWRAAMDGYGPYWRMVAAIRYSVGYAEHGGWKVDPLVIDLRSAIALYIAPPKMRHLNARHGSCMRAVTNGRKKLERVRAQLDADQLELANIEAAQTQLKPYLRKPKRQRK